MEIRVARNKLLVALQRCQGVIPVKGTMPILSYIILEAGEEGISLSATDLDVTIRSYTSAQIIERGSVTLLSRKLFEIVKALPEQEIYIKKQENNYVKLVCGASSFVLVGLPAEDFPALPSYKEQDFFPIDKKILSDMIRRVLFAIPTVETRYTMVGSLLELEGKTISMVATDGHRLAYNTHQLQHELEQKIKVILPKKVLSQLKKLVDEVEGSIAASFQSKHAIFTSEDVVLMGRLLEGSFPNYQKVIPEKIKEEMLIERELLIHALKRVAILSDDNNRSVKFQMEKDTLILSSQESEFGDACEEISVKYSGQQRTIGFNAPYVLDVLGVIDGEIVEIGLNEALAPCLFKAQDATDYLCVIMPMTVQ